MRFMKILRYVLPTYLTALFNTLYTIVDGLYVSYFVGPLALAAINIVYPLVNILYGIGLVFALGSSSLAGLAFGENKEHKASQYFIHAIMTVVVMSLIYTIVIILNLNQVIMFLGGSEQTYQYCQIYSYIWLLFAPIVVIKDVFVFFIRVDGGRFYSFFISVMGGICNIVLDYLFIGIFPLGIFGAGIATVLGLFLSVMLGLFYFVRRRKTICFVNPLWD